MYALAAIQFCVIVLYHMVVYAVGKNFKTKTWLYVSIQVKGVTKLELFSYVNILIQWITKRSNKTSCNNSIELTNDAFASNIPNKAFDYSKYQEPLVY